MIREEIIEKVLRDDPLTKSEQSWWDKHKEDKETQETLVFFQSMQIPLRLQNRKLLKSQLQQIEIQDIKSISERPGVRIVHMKSWFAVAAGMAILAVAITLFYNRQNEDYFNNYFEAYPGIINPVLKGGPSLVTDPLAQAMEAYQNRNYEESLNFFESINSSNDTILFYKANVLLKLERNKDAIIIFQNLKNHDNRFIQESAWYEALTILRLKRTDEAVVLLREITKDKTHPYSDEAKDLLNRLK